MAAKKDFLVEQKATFRKRLVFRDKFKKPIDLTGMKARMHIRDASGVLLCELSTENGRITLGGAAGWIQLFISDDDTALFSFKKALYDLKLIYPDDESDRLLEGSVLVSPGQTE